MLFSLGVPTGHAGLSLEMNVIRYHHDGYYFYPNLMTNSTAPEVPFGDYYISSLNAPTNGASVSYHFDANGFNQNGGSTWGYGDFDSMIHELTNGNWRIYVTNSVITNVYYFTVTANISSNSLPYVSITSPVDGAVNVTNQPTYIWQGPTNYNGLVVYSYNDGASLSITETSWFSSRVLYQGLNSFTAHYDSNSTTAVVASLPVDNTSSPISSWISTVHLQDYSTCQFTVGTVDLSGTSHTLIAHYAWDGTNGDGTASGADTSGNGYDINFGGGYGGQGGVNSTEDPAAGPRAIQFHNGDGNSAGYVGWDPSPGPLLNTLAGSFTVSCWIKTTQNNYGWDQAPAYEGAGIVSADNDGQANDVIPIALTGSKIGFNTGGDDDVTVNSMASVNDGNYHHIVVTRNQQTGQKIIYIDGVMDSFGSGSKNSLNAPQKLTIGALADASDANPNDFNYRNGFDGEVDDLQIYSGVLSAGEVASLYADPGSTTADGGGSNGGHVLLAYYSFEDNNLFAHDFSGHDNNIFTYSWFGTPPYIVTNDAVSGIYAGGFGGSGWFDPSTNLLSTLAGSFSVSLWLKTSDVHGNDDDDVYSAAGIVSAFAGGQNVGMPMGLTGGKLAFYTGGGSGDTLHSQADINTGQYVHVVVTRNQGSGEKKIYVNGVLDASDFGSTDLLNDSTELTIGYNNGQVFTGKMDEIQFYSGVLSASDVAYLHDNPGSTVPDGGGGGVFDDALNTTNLNWTTDGDLPWFTQTSITLDGLAAQSGAIDDDQSSYLETTVPTDGEVSFHWKVSSEEDFDYLRFYINGNEQDSISGDVDWFQESYSVSAGDVLRWEYTKDGSDSDGLDAGFLDQVNYVPTPPSANTAPVITINPFSQTNYPGYSVALFAAATSNPTATWQWFKVGTGLIANATNTLFIPTNSGTAGVAGSYYAVASNLVGTATTLTAVITFANATLPPDWSRAFRTQMENNNNDTTNYNIACMLDSTGTNMYTVGSVNGTNTFGPDTLISRNGGFDSSFLKQTTTGTPIWGRSMTNNGMGSSYAQCIVAAPGDGFYASGNFFGTNWLGTNLLVGVPGGSTWLARFDANGNNLWIRAITGTNFNFTTYHMLASDPAGNVTLSSLIADYTSFGTTNILVQGQKGVLAQYDANGNLRWVQVTSGWTESLGYSAGRLYGSMGADSANFVGGLTNVFDRRKVLFALNATNGQAIWMRGVGAQMDHGPEVFGNDDAYLAVAGTNIFLAGNAYGSNAAFGPFTVTFPTSKGQYFARYDTNGTPQAATAFGSQYTWPWDIVADAGGNIYVGGDFDTYSVFGSNIIAAPFYETVQSVGSIDNRIPGQSFIAKFDRNGNALWARIAQSKFSFVNLRDIAIDSDGVWGCGLFNQESVFGNITINGQATVVGSPFGYLVYHPSGWLAKITDGVGTPLPVTLLNPLKSGLNFQLSFQSQAGFTHSVQYRTNLAIGSWQTYSNVTGDGSLKTIPVPASVFNSSKQGFVRVLTQ
ncbi:MAG: LamG-like jellyroll fold domain-containing protein [Limisphaerales bacterium]